ncbi:MAG: hypothetical protein ACKOCB_09180 [Planctomycetia bacterium]
MSTDDLTEITPEEARELVTRANNEGRGRLSLNGLTQISTDVARELANTEWLSLDGLTQISTDVARELAKSTGCLRLRGLTLIPPDVARELKQGLTVLLWPDWFAAESDGPALDP